MPDAVIERRCVIRAIRVTLRDGSPVIVRPVRASDAKYATTFFDWLSDDTRYSRFMYPVKELTPEMAKSALAQEGLRRVSLVAEPLAPVAGEPPAVALARYAPTDDPDECEVGITVGDAWQSRGVGRVLLKRLIVLARRGCYGSMSATVLSTNAKMIGLARAFRFHISEQSGGVTVMRRALRRQSSKASAGADHIPG
jgi:acetyltransferase